MGDGGPGARQAVVAYTWAVLRAAGGAVPVAVVLTVLGLATVEYVRTDDLIVPMAVWRGAAALAFGLAAVAVAIGIVRATVIVRRTRRTLLLSASTAACHGRVRRPSV